MKLWMVMRCGKNTTDETTTAPSGEMLPRLEKRKRYAGVAASKTLRTNCGYGCATSCTLTYQRRSHLTLEQRIALSTLARVAEKGSGHRLVADGVAQPAAT